MRYFISVLILVSASAMADRNGMYIPEAKSDIVLQSEENISKGIKGGVSSVPSTMIEFQAKIDKIFANCVAILDKYPNASVLVQECLDNNNIKLQ